MSLEINVKKVAAILLLDGWHDVKVGTFDLDAYEFFAGDPDRAPIAHIGGDSGISATGFQCRINYDRNWELPGKPSGDVIAGPLSSILAIRYTS